MELFRVIRGLVLCILYSVISFTQGFIYLGGNSGFVQRIWLEGLAFTGDRTSKNGY